MTYLRSLLVKGVARDLNPGFLCDTLPATISTGLRTLALPYQASHCCLPGPSLQPDLWGTQPSEQPLPTLHILLSPGSPPLMVLTSTPPTQCYLQPLSGPVLQDSSSLIPKTGDECSYQPVARPLPLDKPGDIWVTLKESRYQWWGDYFWRKPSNCIDQYPGPLWSRAFWLPGS